MITRATIISFFLAIIAWCSVGTAQAQIVNNGTLSISDGTVVTFTSAFTNKAGAVLANEGQLYIADSLKNFGDYQHLGGAGLDTIILSSISPSFFSSVPDTFGILRIEGGGSKTLVETSSGVPSQFFINKALVLGNGIVNTNGNKLVLKRNATTNAGNNSTYVDGKLSYIGDGSQRRFPLGVSGKYSPIILRGVSGLDNNFIVSFEAKTGGTPTVGEGLMSIGNVYWERSIVGNFTKYDSLRVDYTSSSASITGVADVQEYVIAQSNAAAGIYQGLGSGFVSGTVASGFTRNAFDATEQYYRVGQSKNNYAQLKVYLQGAYDVLADSMITELKTYGRLDTFQTNIVSPVYAAQPTMTSVGKMLKSNVGAYTAPANAVDVVQVSARSTPNGADLETVTAWLLSDGSVVDYLSGGSKSYITFSQIASGSYYLVVRHRNHLDIMTNDPVVISNAAPTLYDLTNIGNIYGGGALLIDAGVYGMIAGDNEKSDMLRETNASDYYRVSLANDNLSESYMQHTDLTLDIYSNASDVTLSSSNNDQLYFSTVPY